ncbi:fasciclin-like arabinogalactan protein 11 [Primulina huaijiensis]|uniref:fasciclin-like arabinogalactan protein 11 n=1 Tax=Primulina huaijiensis TaxID=1492673 RepID=UPI003CC6E538
MKRLFSPFPLIFLFLVHFHPISSQSPAAAPAPLGPDNLTSILEKASEFTTFIHLLQSTKVGDQIYIRLNNSNQGLTIFAPTDNSFSNLKPGTLNSFTDQQKVELIQFHVVPVLLSPSQFQTTSNPLRTQAGGSEGQFTLNVTATGDQVNITTGMTNATIGNTVYSDNQLAVYQVDQVLLPLSFFVPPPPVSAPSKPKEGAASPDASSDSDRGNPPDSSGPNCRSGYLFLAIFSLMLVLAAFS